MARYHIVANVTISVSVDVEAPSEEEALRIAEEDSDMQGFCHQCASGPDYDPKEPTWRFSGELDGEPSELEITEVS